MYVASFSTTKHQFYQLFDESLLVSATEMAVAPSDL